jgi:hypothetical protein
MKNYLAVYLGTDTGTAATEWEKLSPQDKQKRQAAGMEGWKNWAENNASAIASTGSPIGKTMRVDSSGVSTTKNAICAYTVVQASSHQAAAELFLNHPHFSIFPGDAVEVMECLPLPMG